MSQLMLAFTGLLLVVVAGCSTAPGQTLSVPTDAPPTTVVSTESPAPEPTPTPEPSADLAAIGAAYLEAADRFNPAFANSREVLLRPDITDADRVEIYGDIVETFDIAIADFEAIPWPAEIAEESAGMIAAFVAIRDEFELAVDLPGRDPFPVYEQQVAIYTALADEVRAYLGLPPRPTDPPA